MRFLSWVVLGLLSLSLLAKGQDCSASEQSQISSVSFVDQFFACYDADRNTVGACFSNATGIGATCANCFQAASSCLNSTCSSCTPSPKTPTCITCAKNCESSLRTCTGSQLSFDPCTSFLCSQPSWVLPVIIAGSVLGFILIVIAAYLLMRGGCGGEEGCCSCQCSRLCCRSQLKEDERLEERLRRQNQDRIDKLNRTRDTSSAQSLSGYNKKAEIAKKNVGAEFPDQRDEQFEMSAGFPSPAGDDDIEAQPFEFEVPPERKSRKLGSLRDPFGMKKAEVVKTEHNVRASKLPDDFRKSIQPGLTPEMIFNMSTVKEMKEANDKPLPATVIASHKALKMMGVNESDVQKPYSEPVTARIERLAKAAEKQGLMSGGATANLGNQIAEQFEVKRKAAEARAEAMRQQQLKKEEERIRQEISRENKAELTEKRRTLRESGKLSPEDAKRLSLAAAARRSAKAAGAAGNKLKDFLERNDQS